MRFIIVRQVYGSRRQPATAGRIAIRRRAVRLSKKMAGFGEKHTVEAVVVQPVERKWAHRLSL
ncbi:hypothetical protein [Desulfosoma sp.]|uniref:hypothetical protein n=1 Tax=Desulfosoma sp. TaxID=2603217 RepID=UPI00404A7E8D